MAVLVVVFHFESQRFSRKDTAHPLSNQLLSLRGIQILQPHGLHLGDAVAVHLRKCGIDSNQIAAGRQDQDAFRSPIKQEPPVFFSLSHDFDGLYLPCLSAP